MRGWFCFLVLAAMVGGVVGVAAHWAWGQSTRGAATAPASRPGGEMVVELGDKVVMKLVRIPAGTFLMGSPETEEGREAGEVQHEVTISKAFYMGVTHVTVEQFGAFVKESGYSTEAEEEGAALRIEIRDGKFEFERMEGCSWRAAGFEQKGDHPAVMISWQDAKAFCEWLAKKSGKAVSLPTEAQWEYACRGGTKTAYPWGDNPDDGKGWANCADQGLLKKLPNMGADWKAFSWDDGFLFTAPVGSFKANAFGLYDMNGNGWQWCADLYGAYEKGAVVDPTGPETGGAGVLRGGSWGYGPRFCRSAHRGGYAAGDWIGDYGFRVVVGE